jgi:hypothetical protein
MTVWIIALTLAYVSLAVLLLSLNLRSRWSWPVKAAAIVVTGGFYLLTYFAWHGLSGWPATTVPPEDFVLVASEIREPDKRTADPGAIFIWARATADPLAQPRAYQLPYTGALHQAVEAARQRQGEGVGQVGRRNLSTRRPGTGPPGGPAIRFEDMPRLGLPLKN